MRFPTYKAREKYMSTHRYSDMPEEVRKEFDRLHDELGRFHSKSWLYQIWNIQEAKNIHERIEYLFMTEIVKERLEGRNKPMNEMLNQARNRLDHEGNEISWTRKTVVEPMGSKPRNIRDIINDKGAELLSKEEDEHMFNISLIPAKEKKICALAQKHGWRLVDRRPNEMKLRFKKGVDDLIDVWHSKMTVATIINHPKRGRQQLFRKKVTMEMLEKLFINPRLHTGEGYYQH